MGTLFAFRNSYNKSYFEAARSPKKRSLLFVNEHFSGKADAERALLDGFRYICFRKRATGIPNISRYLATVRRAMQ